MPDAYFFALDSHEPVIKFSGIGLRLTVIVGVSDWVGIRRFCVICVGHI